jgi:hypothetical protein
MDESTKATIDKILVKLEPILAQADKFKAQINGLCELDGDPLMFPDVGDARSATTASSKLFPLQRSDQFFGRPMATVVKEVLQWRGKSGLGATSIDDLYSTMEAGGFEFQGADEANRKRTFASTLGRNPAFRRVPSSGHYGLTEWYPAARDKKPKNGDDAEATEPTPESNLNSPENGESAGAVERPGA